MIMSVADGDTGCIRKSAGQRPASHSSSAASNLITLVRHDFDNLSVGMLHGPDRRWRKDYEWSFPHRDRRYRRCRKQTELSSASRTAFRAEEMLADTFIAQLPEAPSHMMPLTSPIMLLTAMAMVSKLPFISQIIPAAAPIPAVVWWRRGPIAAEVDSEYKWRPDVIAPARGQLLLTGEDALQPRPPASWR